MTLVSQIVIDMLRESNLVPLGESGDAAQGQEALRILNRLVQSVFGNEVGERLNDWLIPGPLGVVETMPWDNYLWADLRLIIASGGAQTFQMDPNPQNGDRLQLVDAGSDFSANPITLQRGTALFEGGTADYVADTEGFNTTWIYNAAAANWAKVSPLLANDEFPFPEAYDDAFIGLGAVRLSPRYEKAMSSESQASLQRSLSQLRAAYAQTRRTSADLAVLRLSGAGYSSGYGGGPITTQRFLNGWPF
jgi:hypothetical protein